MKKSNRFLENIKSRLNVSLNTFEAYLRNLIGEDKQLFPKFLLNGKRLRPIAYLLFSKAYNSFNEKTILFALSIELLHASSLIHDDIIDDEESRRNEISLNKFYGNKLAVLSGDYLFVKSLEMAYSINEPSLISKFIKTSQRMIKGEVMEETLSLNQKLNEENYFKIIYYKTASLFEYAFSGLEDAGRKLGFAYQIIDDCEDFFDDLKDGKITLALIKAYQKDSDILNYLDNHYILKNKLSKLGAFEMAINQAISYIEEFKKTISFDQELYEAFSDYVSYLTYRSMESLDVIKS